VKAFEDAGCIGVEMELLPSPLADYITKNTSILTISLGSGVHCDAQFLFSCDALGLHDEHYPRHAKTYVHFLDTAVDALRQYKEEVLSGRYPGEQHSLSMAPTEFSNSLAGLDKS